MSGTKHPVRNHPDRC